MKLACIGPVSPLRTGISYFNERLLPYLSERCAVTPFTDRTLIPPGAAEGARTPDMDEFLAAPERFDAALYHMGNHYRYHRRIYEALLRAPGFVLLHDCILSHFFAKYYLERGDFGAFRKLLATQPEIDPDKRAHEFYGAKADLYQYSLSGVIAMASRGTIVMTDYGKSIISKEASGAALLKIQFPYFQSNEQGTCTPDLFRKKYDIPPDHFLVTSIGHITPAKRMDVAVAAFRKFHEQFPNSLFLIAGEASAYSPVDRNSRLAGIRHLGYLERAEVDCLMQLSDVCINLRYPSQGEMSSTLIDMLGRGKAVAVSNYAQFAEFPNDICIKVDLGWKETDLLAGALLTFATNRKLVQNTGAAAREYIARNHDPREAAGAIVQFIQAHAATKPLFGPHVASDLLDSDKLPARYMQALAYNGRRILSYIKEQGGRRLITETLRRVAEKRD